MPKCKVCKKNLSLVDQIIGKCKCDKIFCHKHRYPKEHKCTFDHHKSAKETLMKQNPVVKSDKVVKI